MLFNGTNTLKKKIIFLSLSSIYWLERQIREGMKKVQKKKTCAETGQTNNREPLTFTAEL